MPTVISRTIFRSLLPACRIVCVTAGLSGALGGCVTVQERAGQSGNPANPGIDSIPQETTAEAQQQREAEQARLREDADRRRQQASAENAGVSTPAVVALRTEAETEVASGNLQTANLLLERALRIDPADASTYLQLAQLRLGNQEYGQAAALARRGLSLNPRADIAAELEQLVMQAENPPALKNET